MINKIKSLSFYYNFYNPINKMHLKAFLLNAFCFAFFIVSIFSCSKEANINVENTISCNDGIQNGDEVGIDCGGSCSNPCPLENALEGILITRMVLQPDVDYILTGPLIVRDGAILEMNAGTVIKAQKNSNAYIGVAQGGKIYVWGTEENPVVITSNSNNPAPGDWGGLVICGKAPSNNGDLPSSELLNFFYGGNEINNTSGVIKYLRLEYTGENFNESKRFNGISFYGVGAFTTIEHIQTFKSLGNGFEIIGGTMKAKWLVSINSNQNSINIKDGWNGQGNSWYVKGALEAGIKIENNFENETAQPFSTGTINNVTILEPGTLGALHYTAGGGLFNFNEIYTSNLNLGINVEGNQSNSMVDLGNLNINNIQFDNTVNGFSPTNYTGTNSNFYIENNTTGAGNSALQPDWAMNWTIGF